jgi:pimeloyl-ACP methyl ester carboxylesterase
LLHLVFDESLSSFISGFNHFDSPFLEKLIIFYMKTNSFYKKSLVGFFLFWIYIVSFSQQSRIIKIRLSDGDTLTGKLDFPENPKIVKELVIFVHGTGPSTYLDRRKIGGIEFNYFDLFSQELNKKGIAFFTYNRRGVSLTNTPPTYDTVDIVKYKKYLPVTESIDIGNVIRYLKNEKQLGNARIVLLGWSEGTIIAPLVALDKRNQVDALLLAGYANENMSDIIKWQNSGGSSMVNLRKYFDTDSDKVISRAEYESKDTRATSMRTRAFKDTPFRTLDVTGDSLLSSEDFGILNKNRLDKIMDAFEKGDDDWIWNNYFRVTTLWYNEHRALEANKTSLLHLDIPIYIFEGLDDGSTPAEGAYDVQKRFRDAGKTNLQCYFFKGHNHDLNYTDWPFKKTISPGISKIFEIADLLQK